MTDEHALLAAIWAEPHDDTPRLVYADWLQENGQPERAEFIRLQCLLATLEPWDDRRPVLEKREKQLAAKHGMAWKAALGEVFRKRSGFHRGFPNPPLSNVTSAKFLKFTAAHFAGAPLWTFRLPPNIKELPKILAHPGMTHVGTLDLRLWVESSADAKQIASARTVRNVASLNLGASRFDDAAACELAVGKDALPHLRHLDLEFTRVTADGVAGLAASPLADRLESLSLSHASTDRHGIGEAGVEALAGSPRLGRLKALDLSHFVTGRYPPEAPGRAVRALFESKYLGALRSLRLYGCGLGDGAVVAVCEARPRFRLADLNLPLQHPPITDAGAEALAAWPALGSLRVLNLAHNAIGWAGALALARSPHLGDLTELFLGGNPIPEAGRAALRDRFGRALRT